MKIKRYDFDRAHCAGDSEFGCPASMEECSRGDYVRWEDLIAAGCLVPVPDGEVCEYADSNCDLMTVDGVLVGFDGCGLPIWLHGENDDVALHSTIVQPVRLVRLEDLG